MGLEEGDKILEKAREFVVSQKAREKVYKDLSERDSIAKYLG